jgi:hypothetical protein
MLEMKALEPAPTVAALPASREAWRWQHAIVLLGCVSVILAAVLACVFVFFLRPIPPSETFTPEMAQEAAQNLTPTKTLELWEYYQQGLDRRTSPRYEAQLRIYHLAEGFCAVLAVAGAALIVAGATAHRPHNSLT